MHHGFCDIVINEKVSGQVEYRYDNTGQGALWISDELVHRTFEAKRLALTIDGIDKDILIRISTPGEATPFVFKEWLVSR
ncbi:hypothetical protein D3C80_2102010 [compost metagenome]|nr:hypothetical protein CQ062_22400 [Ochrobactrum sp. MYb68]